MPDRQLPQLQLAQQQRQQQPLQLQRQLRFDHIMKMIVILRTRFVCGHKEKTTSLTGQELKERQVCRVVYLIHNFNKNMIF